VRGLFVEDYEPLSQASADEIRHMMLSETEELEQMTGRDLSSWKPGAKREESGPLTQLKVILSSRGLPGCDEYDRGSRRRGAAGQRCHR